MFLMSIIVECFSSSYRAGKSNLRAENSNGHLDISQMYGILISLVDIVPDIILNLRTPSSVRSLIPYTF